MKEHQRATLENREYMHINTAGTPAHLGAESKEAALDGADCLAICTEWKAFRSPDFEGIKQRLSSALIFDGRNLYDPQYMVALEIEYYAIGRGRSVQLSD